MKHSFVCTIIWSKVKMKTFLWLFLLSSFEVIKYCNSFDSLWNTNKSTHFQIFISSETGSPTVDENYFWFDGTHWLNEKQFDEEYKYVYDYYLQGNGPYEVIKSKWLKGTAFDDKYKFDCNDPLGSGTYGYVCSGIQKLTFIENKKNWIHFIFIWCVKCGSYRSEILHFQE